MEKNVQLEKIVELQKQKYKVIIETSKGLKETTINDILELQEILKENSDYTGVRMTRIN